MAEENVSAFDAKITRTMVRNYLTHKGAALNAFADFIGASVVVADLGMGEKYAHENLRNFSVRAATKNIAKGAAMTAAECAQAVENGRRLAKEATKKGAKYILPAEMGIGNTTSSAAMASALLNLSAEKVTGRGTNISDEKLLHKINIVRKATEINKPYKDAMDILSKLGGFELAAITGIILEAKRQNVKIIMDGLNTTVAAVIAQRIEPDAKKILVPSHLAGEAAHKYLLEELGLTAAMDLDFHLGEACGSSIMAKCMEAVAPPLEPVYIDVAVNGYQKELAKEAMRERFANLSMPRRALGALEEIAVTLAGEFGTINIKENIPLNKNWLNSLGICDEKYLINDKRLPHLAEVLTRASLYVLNRMKTFEEAEILD